MILCKEVVRETARGIANSEAQLRLAALENNETAAIENNHTWEVVCISKGLLM